MTSIFIKSISILILVFSLSACNNSSDQTEQAKDSTLEQQQASVNETEQDDSVIPSQLQPYLIGENADGFVIFKNNGNLQEFFYTFRIEEFDANNIKSAVVTFNNFNSTKVEETDFLIALEFSKQGQADALIEVIKNSQFSQNVSFEKVEGKEILLIKNNLNESNKLIGDFSNHPIFETNLIQNNQFTLYIQKPDQSFSSSLASLVSNIHNSLSSNNTENDFFSMIINTAHAQFLSEEDIPSQENNITEAESLWQNYRDLVSVLIYGSEDMVIEGNLEENDLSIEYKFNNYQPRKPLNGLEWSEFDDLNQQLNEVVKELKEETNANLTFTTQGTNANLIYNANIEYIRNRLKPNAQLPPIDSSGPSRARDAGRKANTSSIVMSLEQYIATNGDLPNKSGCFEDFTELKEFFPDFDEYVNADTSFGSINCESEYYVQSNPDYGYRVWTKLENSAQDEGADLTGLQSPLVKNPESNYWVIDSTNGVSSSETKQKRVRVN